MKNIRLALQQIGAMFSRQKFLFILFSLGVTLCSLVLTYYWGSGNYGRTYTDITPFVTYEVNDSQPTMNPQDALDREAVSKLEQTVFPIPVKEYLYQSYMEPEAIPGVDLAPLLQNSFTRDLICYIYSYRNNTVENHAWVGRGEFSEEELSTGARVAIGPSELFTKLDPDNPTIVTLRDIPFEIIGALPIYNFLWFCIPYQTMVQEDFPITSIHLTFERVPTREEDAEITAILYELFPEGTTIETPLTDLDMRDGDTRYSMIISIVLYLIAFFTMMFLMKYLLDCSRHEMVVFSVVGASKKRALLLLLLQNSLLVLFSGLVAFALFFALKRPFFDIFAPAPDYQYTGTDLITVLLLELVLSFVIALPFLLQFIRKTPAQLNRSER